MKNPALIWIRALSWPTGYALAFDSFKGFTCPMSMDFASLLHHSMIAHPVDNKAHEDSLPHAH